MFYGYREFAARVGFLVYWICYYLSGIQMASLLQGRIRPPGQCAFRVHEWPRVHALWHRAASLHWQHRLAHLLPDIKWGKSSTNKILLCVSKLIHVSQSKNWKVKKCIYMYIYSVDYTEVYNVFIFFLKWYSLTSTNRFRCFSK